MMSKFVINGGDDDDESVASTSSAAASLVSSPSTRTSRDRDPRSEIRDRGRARAVCRARAPMGPDPGIRSTGDGPPHTPTAYVSRLC